MNEFFPADAGFARPALPGDHDDEHLPELEGVEELSLAIGRLTDRLDHFAEELERRTDAYRNGARRAIPEPEAVERWETFILRTRQEFDTLSRLGWPL
ncbi:hypothetical protein [Gloeobacter morelensis]|uniref:Uncharacterized protein n=1 Tax=Gloeobacter morelensis MG652769 TaxID=2781736 RepID=A0ABY3PQN4_9CYAN|nr:hypothetical protein [Gloeobacter morelensis]UFP95834.1 hypothetical protein ISF26_06265 [Gloeobacter morelensis MG652769]